MTFLHNADVNEVTRAAAVDIALLNMGDYNIKLLQSISDVWGRSDA